MRGRRGRGNATAAIIWDSRHGRLSHRNRLEEQRLDCAEHEGPCKRRWACGLEVPRSAHDDQLNIVSGLLRRGLKVPRLLLGNIVLAAAPDQHLPDAEWQQPGQRYLRISIGSPIREASHQPAQNRHPARGFVLRYAHRHVHAAGKVDNPSRPHGRLRVQRRTWLEPVARSRPMRQMPARGMTKDDHATQVEAVSRRQAPQVVDAFAHVAIGAWPAAPGLRETAILDAPGRDALSLERIGHRADRARTRVVLAEASPMHEDHHRVRSAAGRQSQLPTLAGLATIGQDVVRCLDRQRHQICGRHDRLINVGQPRQSQQGQKNERGRHDLPPLSTLVRELVGVVGRTRQRAPSDPYQCTERTRG